MSHQEESTSQSVNKTNYDEFNAVEKQNNSTCKESSSVDEDSNENKKEYIKNNEENEEEDDINLDSFTLNENSDLYTICVNDVPICYVKDEKTAIKRMWDLARIQTFDSNCSGWRTNLVQVHQNELHILGSYKFFIVSYDQVLKRISYNRVQECVDV